MATAARRRHAGGGGAAAAEWASVSTTGAWRVEPIGKHQLMRRTGLPARDLRALDPALTSYPSSVVGRDRAVVVNLERVRAVITASEVLVPGPRDPAAVPLVSELRARLAATSAAAASPAPPQAGAGKDGGGVSPPGGGGGKVLPFEFRALEVCLQYACKSLEHEASMLEKEAYPALDALTSKVSTLNLEHVRQIKSRLVAISGGVHKVRDELEHLLDDDADMAAMHLSEKAAFQAAGGDHSSRFGDDVAEEPAVGDDGARDGYDGESDEQEDEGSIVFMPKIDELENLLEAYFVQIDGTLSKLSTLREYVEDTEDYINIMLDDKQNQLLQMGVVLSTATLMITGAIVVTAVFGMNIRFALYDNPDTNIFWEANGGMVGGATALFVVAMLYLWNKGILRHAGAGAASAEWAAVSTTGAWRVEPIGKHQLMRRTGLRARDLRVLDPAPSPYPSSVVGRDRAVVVNLERVRAVITASEVLVPGPRDPAVAPLVSELRARLSAASPAPPQDEAGKDGGGVSPPGGGGGKVLPFEFRALEVCLEHACKSLEHEASMLEKEAYPALDALTSTVSTLNLERVRQIKSRLVAISGGVHKVRDELEHLLDDDADMAAMHLSEKAAFLAAGDHYSRFGDVAEEAVGDDGERDGYDDESDEQEDQGSIVFLPKIDELEKLLEAYFVQIDGTLNKLSTLREYVEDTEDYINTTLDDKQNQLLQMGVVLSTATLTITAAIVVTGVLAMNIHFALYKTTNTNIFWEATGGTVGGAATLFIVAMLYFRKKGIFR
ncbi:hypothetical protein U9M48_037985 [Paspalum notatum var. saurae]|uniref:Putative magnesium transporter MRS2-D n=1 Tax=Paspalum notatum var. saurae TaxID=547442 RepID=A0AAQ3XB80_PASNO